MEMDRDAVQPGVEEVEQQQGHAPNIQTKRSFEFLGKRGTIYGDGNGYFYITDRIRTGKRYLKCAKVGSCRARAVMDIQKNAPIIPSHGTPLHNHLEDKNHFTIKQFMERLKERTINERNIRPLDIFEDESQRNPNISFMVSKSHAIRMMQKVRRPAMKGSVKAARKSIMAAPQRQSTCDEGDNFFGSETENPGAVSRETADAIKELIDSSLETTPTTMDGNSDATHPGDEEADEQSGNASKRSFEFQGQRGKIYGDGNGYYYIAERERNGKRYLRCMNQRTCRARAMMVAEKEAAIIPSKGSPLHNHQADQNITVIREFMGRLKERAINERGVPPSEIFEDEALRNPNISFMISKMNAVRVMQRVRQQSPANSRSAEAARMTISVDPQRTCDDGDSFFGGDDVGDSGSPGSVNRQTDFEQLIDSTFDAAQPGSEKDQQPGPPPNTRPSFEFQGQRGTIFGDGNGYYYVAERVRSGKRYLKCVKAGTCRARAIMSAQDEAPINPTKGSPLHNHQQDENLTAIKEFMHRLKERAMNERGVPPLDIFEDEAQRNPNIAFMVSKVNAIRQMRRVRQQNPAIAAVPRAAEPARVTVPVDTHLQRTCDDAATHFFGGEAGSLGMVNRQTAEAFELLIDSTFQVAPRTMAHQPAPHQPAANQHPGPTVQKTPRRSLQRVKRRELPEIQHTCSTLEAARATIMADRRLHRTRDDGDNFFVCDKIGETGSLGFVSRRMAEVFSRHPTVATELFIDSSFQVVPRQHSLRQLLSVHVLYMKMSFPVAFFLMPNATDFTYSQILRYLRNNVITWVVTHVTTDFERSLTLAVREVFPQAEVHGSWFHYCQTIWRSVVTFGLRRACQEDERMMGVIRMIMSVPHLPPQPGAQKSSDTPPHSIADGVEAVRAFIDQWRLDSRLHLILDYVRRFWLRIPAEQFTTFGKPRRTNNGLETFHSRLMALLGPQLPNLWQFIDHLQQLEQEFHTDLRRVEAGIRIRKAGTAVKSSDKNIKEAMRLLIPGEVTLVEFLQRVAYCCNNSLNLFAHPLRMLQEEQPLANDEESGWTDQQESFIVEVADEVVVPMQMGCPTTLAPATSAPTHAPEPTTPPARGRPRGVGGGSQAQRQCSMCLKRRKTHAAIPCGHKSVCPQCAADQMRLDARWCSQCGAFCTNYVRIF